MARNGQNPIRNASTGRRTLCNVWGNTYGYIGRKRVMDFGTDEYDANLWRDHPEKYDKLVEAERNRTKTFLKVTQK